jgi:hypothetical protein
MVQATIDLSSEAAERLTRGGARTEHTRAQHGRERAASRREHGSA